MDVDIGSSAILNGLIFTQKIMCKYAEVMKEIPYLSFDSVARSEPSYFQEHQCSGIKGHYGQEKLCFHEIGSAKRQ